MALISSARFRTAALMIDQGWNSGTNVLVTLVAAHGLKENDFGAFATAQLIVAFAEIVAMAAIGDYWLKKPEAVRRVCLSQNVSFFVVLCISGIGFSIIGSVVFGPQLWLISACSIPAITGLDYVRIYAFATRRVGFIVPVDACYGASQLAGVGAWFAAGEPLGATGAWLAWGGSATCVFVVSVIVLQLDGSLKVSLGVRAWTRVVSLRYGFEYIAIAGGSQCAQLLVSAEVGETLNGLIRAGQLPFAALTVALQGARALLIPKMQDKKQAGPAVALCSMGYVAVTAVLLAVSLVLTQDAAVEKVVLGNVRLGAGLVCGEAFWFASLGVYTILVYYCRAQGLDARVTCSRVAFVGLLIPIGAISIWLRSATVFVTAVGFGWAVAAAVVLMYHRDGHVMQTNLIEALASLGRKRPSLE